MAPAGVGNTVIIQPRYPLGVDPVAMCEMQEAAADRRELQRAAPPRKPLTGPPPLTEAIMRAARAVPQVVKTPDEPDLELEPVTDSDIPDNPEMDVRG